MEEDRIRHVQGEAERAQQARLLGTLQVVLFTAVVSLALVALVIGAFSAAYDPWPRIGLLLTLSAVCLVSYALLRAGWMRWAGALFFLGTVAVIALAVVLVGFSGPESILLLLLIIMGGLLAGGKVSLILSAVSIMLYAGAAVAEQWGFYTPPLRLDATSGALVTVGVYLVAFGLMGLAGWLSGNNLQDALRQADQQAVATQEKNAELESLKDDLERRVAERTLELTRALETVAALSAPIIPLAEGVIILPLVGHVDEPRMHRVISSLLTGIRAYRARTALLEVTGLATVDATVAAHLVEAGLGARLLGCELVLVGVRAEVARALAGLNVDLAGVVSRADLQSGIEYALKGSV